MNSPFFKESKKIVDAFIRSILFVDDEIYTDKEDKTHNLESESLARAFSKSKKLCALNNPKYEEDLDDVIEIAKKSDITVLDWRIILQDNKEEDRNEEEDVTEDDPRGTFALNLLDNVLSDPISGSNSLKLILIYTGETDLKSIVEKIHKKVASYGVDKLEKNIVGKTNLKIIVAGKPTLKNRLRHNSDLQDWVIEYEDVPNFLLDKFTEMTTGIVSNVALSAITNIRNNSFKLLKQYNKDLDPAFLAHRSMLPVPDDAGELLIASLIDSFRAIIDYSNVKEECSYSSIAKWIDSNKFSEKNLKINKKDIEVKAPELKKWQSLGYYEAFEKIWKKQRGDSLNKDKLNSSFRELHKKGQDYFFPDGYSDTTYNEKFSILTHHKSNFSTPSYVPILSLGTIIKGKNTDKYWLCLQQRCDSIRIPKDEARRFLFLPLIPMSDNKKFHILVENETNFLKLKIDYGTHSIRTIKFKANKYGVIRARKFGPSKEYFFRPFYSKGNEKYDKKVDENFIWIMDLKESHAQRVSHLYSSKLSRVGLDESEWLRRWGD